MELLLLRLIHSSCDDLQKPKVVGVEGKQQEKQGVAMAFYSTWQVIEDGDGLGVFHLQLAFDQ